MLLDTSGLFCLHHAEERWHEEAREVFDSAGRKLAHSYVLAEFVALANSRGSRRDQALAFAESLIAQPDVSVVWVDRDLHDRGMRLLLTRRDKRYSLADAVSFVLMRERGVAQALTTDHHFEQAGFVRLLRD
jgi:predicted nucleic acid-binding protein